jgi:hypothetical protein
MAGLSNALIAVSIMLEADSWLGRLNDGKNFDEMNFATK